MKNDAASGVALEAATNDVDLRRSKPLLNVDLRAVSFLF